MCRQRKGLSFGKTHLSLQSMYQIRLTVEFRIRQLSELERICFDIDFVFAPIIYLWTTFQLIERI